MLSPYQQQQLRGLREAGDNREWMKNQQGMKIRCGVSLFPSQRPDLALKEH